MWRHILSKGTGLVLGLTLGTAALAQADFPTRPINLLVGFAAGGGTDLVARKIAEGMEQALGQPVVVVNRPGGGGLISWKELMASKPDGYSMTLFLPSNAFIQKHLKSSTSWVDPLKDVRHLGLVNQDPWGIAIGANAPFADAKGFVEWTKKNADAKVSDGGPATAYHWGWRAFAEATGANIRPITYRGATADGLKAVAGGEVLAAAAGAPEANSMMEAGHVKMLGIAADERLPAYPAVPTFKEQGVPFVFGITRGVAVPVGTPEPIVKKLADALAVTYKSEKFQAFLKEMGFGGFYLDPEQTAAYLKEQDASFRDLMKKAGMLRDPS